MTTLNWERLPGETVEEFVAAALVLEHGGGCRLTPAQGDGGIDVLLPLSDGTWKVVQVKRYSGRLEARHRASVQASWLSFLREDLPLHVVTKWALAAPTDLTPGELAWLQGLPPVPLIKETMGRTRLDGLASRNQQLVNYYFGDGRSRTEDLLAAVLHGTSPVSGHEAHDLLTGVTSRQQALSEVLDSIDPFYRYDVSTRLGEVPVSGSQQFYADAEGAAMVQYELLEHGRHNVMRIIPRCPLSAQLRPIRKTIRVDAEPGSAEHARWADFVNYGIPFENGPGEVLEAVGPPGTGGVGRSLFSFDVPRSADFGPLELRVVGADSLDAPAIISLPLVAPQVSRGPIGDGVWLRSSDQSELLHVELRAGGPDEMWMLYIRHGPLTGHPAVEADLVGRLMGNLQPGRFVALATPGGLALQPPIPLLDKHADLGLWDVVRDFARLQAHTSTRVRLPDLETVSTTELNRLRSVVKVLDGEVLDGEWTPTELVLDPATPRATLPSAAGPATRVEPPHMPLAGVTVDLQTNLLVAMDSVLLQLDRTGSRISLAHGSNPHAALSLAPDDQARGLYFPSQVGGEDPGRGHDL